ncbi:MAG: FKBP-type peptidyl-prolyl cis-trans isomerase [Bacteroidales bacterium]|nr:FKBP-type peptidyl-prolyl cis-trans isomerase [Bacteroidales bacterium]
MKRNYFTIAAVCLLTMLLFTACTQKYPGYKKTGSGLYYKFYSHNTKAQKPKQTDVLKVAMTCYLGDSVYFDFQQTESQVYAQLKASVFPADLNEAYSLMNLGDSASFYIKADSVAIKYYDKQPEAVGLKPDDYFRYEVKLLEIKSMKEFQAEIDNMNEILKDRSRKELADYVEANFQGETPDSSGIYVVTLEPSKGRCPERGEKVELDFSATLLNGQLVGSTFDSTDKFSFVLGDGYAIQGWEEIVPKMHLGERVKAVIPFEMAYGEHSVGSIPAYSNLVYDMKLLKITTKEELRKEKEQALADLKIESEKAFADYLSANAIMDCTPSGLYYSKSQVTDGQSPRRGQKVRIKFVATYLDGTPLGNSDDLGDYFEAVYGDGSLLKGLEEGIGLMRVGEKARFVLPYTLAYGEYPYNDIPGCSNFVFDVELLDIIK